jgi:hypothetical protein
MSVTLYVKKYYIDPRRKRRRRRWKRGISHLVISFVGTAF